MVAGSVSGSSVSSGGSRSSTASARYGLRKDKLPPQVGGTSCLLNYILLGSMVLWREAWHSLWHPVACNAGRGPTKVQQSKRRMRESCLTNEGE
eukprot:1157484-Pelagomonas_calceolata.AAC.2